MDNISNDEDYILQNEQNISDMTLKMGPSQQSDSFMTSTPSSSSTISSGNNKTVRKRNPRQCLAPGCTKCSQGRFPKKY